jgi:YD repeat-containing protein
LCLFFSCKKEIINETPYLPRLYKITQNNKPVFTFDYDEAGRLIGENEYLSCDTEIRKTTYRYSDGRLVSHSVKEKLLGHNGPVWYPGSQFVEDCSDRATYRTQTSILKYNQAGRVTKITNDNYVSEYVYESNGTAKATLTSGPSFTTTYSRYDTSGNLIEEKGEGSGNVVLGHPIGFYYGNIPDDDNGLKNYLYDSGRNPLYNIVIWPFHFPGNLKKLYRNNLEFEWSYKYDEHGFPLERMAANGSKWIYHYR